MFTGLIEEIGEVKSIISIGGGKKITVLANKIMDDLKIDDSVSLNGCCQTVVSHEDKTFEVIAIEETLRKTTLGNFRPGQKINLERALLPTSRMGGHIVQGHVDAVGTVIKIIPESTGILVTISFPQEFAKYIVPVGSICLEGVSLTAARVEGNYFTVAIIPHTWEVTNLGKLQAGDKVNLEFDVIGKYIEKMMNKS